VVFDAKGIDQISRLSPKGKCAQRTKSSKDDKAKKYGYNERNDLIFSNG
jgi:hypothetical protein